MDFLKVLDQTVRDLKREVNLNILKVPEIEQKVMDATSNEAWGPHGTLMSEIAQATRNYSEYQIIMPILWTRVGDTGKNWRHVYKALTVLEFLVAHGSEKVIDDIQGHSYQLSVLADFQYVEPNGKDQGINVRKKSQAIMVLVNDKEKVKEVREKAMANRDKYQGVSSSGAILKPGSYYSSGDRFIADRYGDNYGGASGRARNDDRYGRDGESGNFEDEDPYDRGGHRYGREGAHGKGNEPEESRYRSMIRDNDGGDDALLTRNGASSKPTKHSNTQAGDDGDDFDPRGDNEEFDPRASTARVTPPAQALAPSLLGDDLFIQVESMGAEKTVHRPAVGNDDIFGDFITSGPASSAASQQINSIQVGESLFKTDPSLFPSFPNAAANLPPPPPPSTNRRVTSNTFDAFAVDSASQNTTTSFGGDDPFKGHSFDSFGHFQSDTGTILQSNMPPGQHSTNVVTQELKSGSSVSSKPPEKEKFEPKSSVWADSLSKGLIDLDLGGPKSNSLADIGIEFDLLGAERTKEERSVFKSSAFGKGKAMGAGSGLGLAGANALAPPVGPIMMNNLAGSNGVRAPMSMGMSSGMQSRYGHQFTHNG